MRGLLRAAMDHLDERAVFDQSARLIHDESSCHDSTVVIRLSVVRLSAPA